MFFPKLRRRAKWVFFGLALAFALGFVGFGVGAGGSGIGDFVSDFLNREPASNAPSVEDARAAVRKRPNDPQARQDLADALQAEGRTAEAIAALETYTTLRPRDLDALQQLNGLLSNQIGVLRDRATIAQLEAQGEGFGQIFEDQTSTLSQALGQGSITEVIAGDASQKVSEAFAALQGAYSRQATVLASLTEAQPEEPGWFLQLGQAAQLSGDTEQAIDAYKGFLELAPDDPSGPAVKQTLKELQTAPGVGGTSSG